MENDVFVSLLYLTLRVNTTTGDINLCVQRNGHVTAQTHQLGYIVNNGCSAVYVRRFTLYIYATVHARSGL